MVPLQHDPGYRVSRPGQASAPISLVADTNTYLVADDGVTLLTADDGTTLLIAG